MEEEYKDIKGFEDYQISNYGNLLSKGRYVLGGTGYRFIPDRVLKKVKCKATGAIKYNIKNNKCQNIVTAHVLVAEAFLKYNRDDQSLRVIHKDGNKENNRVDNLKIITRRDNQTVINKKNGVNEYTGVSEKKISGKHQVAISFNNTCVMLGRYDNKQTAHKIYQLAKKHIENFHKERRELLGKLEKNKIIPNKIKL